MSGTPKLTRLLPPSAMRRPPKENSTQAPCVRLTTLFSRAPKADCPTRAPSAHFFRASRLLGVSLQPGTKTTLFKIPPNTMNLTNINDQYYVTVVNGAESISGHFIEIDLVQAEVRGFPFVNISSQVQFM